MPQLEHLARREREILNAVFALGRASVEDVRARLKNPPSYSSVRVMLARLEKKGYVRHTEDGTRYLYTAVLQRSAASKRQLAEYVRTFFGGSVAQMVTALVRRESWTLAELEEVSRAIERARRQRARHEEAGDA